MALLDAMKLMKVKVFDFCVSYLYGIVKIFVSTKIMLSFVVSYSNLPFTCFFIKVNAGYSRFIVDTYLSILAIGGLINTPKVIKRVVVFNPLMWSIQCSG